MWRELLLPDCSTKSNLRISGVMWTVHSFGQSALWRLKVATTPDFSFCSCIDKCLTVGFMQLFYLHFYPRSAEAGLKMIKISWNLNKCMFHKVGTSIKNVSLSAVTEVVLQWSKQALVRHMAIQTPFGSIKIIFFLFLFYGTFHNWCQMLGQMDYRLSGNTCNYTFILKRTMSRFNEEILGRLS